MVVRSFSTGGGLELYVHKLVERLLKKGLRITVICEEAPTTLQHSALSIINFPRPSQKLSKWQRLTHQFKSASTAVLQSGPYDLVHSQHFPVAGAQVVTFHNHSVSHLSQVGHNWENALNAIKGLVAPAYRLRDKYDHMLCQQARSFIFPATVCREDFCQAYASNLNLASKPYVIAHPGADLAASETSGALNPALPDATFTFLFVGRGYRRKGLDTTLRALSILQQRKIDFRLLVAGLPAKGIDSLRLCLLGLQGKVQFLGFCQDMSAVYKKAQVFIAPSRHDVFGMAPLQAMHYGLVPVVSRSMGVSELLEHETNALILKNHLDANELACLLQKLIENSALLSRLQANVPQVAAATTWDACAEATIEAYHLALDAIAHEDRKTVVSLY